jgi:hypothetical protein
MPTALTLPPYTAQHYYVRQRQIFQKIFGAGRKSGQRNNVRILNAWPPELFGRAKNWRFY